MIFQELNPVLEQIRARAQKDQAEAEVLIARNEKLSISMNKGELDKFDSGLSLCAGLRVIKDGSEGYCSTENLAPEALMQAYDEALANAVFTAKHRGERDQDLGLISEGAKGVPSQAKSLVIDAKDVPEKISLARRVEEGSLKRDERVVAVPYNGFIEATGAVRVFNTKGVDCSYDEQWVTAYAYALAKSGEESRSGYESRLAKTQAQLNPDDVGQKAADKALAKLGSKQPASGAFPVLFETEPATGMLDLLVDYLSGKAVSEKRSLYSNDLGKMIATSQLTIVDDPFLKDGPGSRPFDSEGTPSQKLTLIENGMLKAFLLNSVYARKLGMPNTGHASRSPRTELEIGPSNIIVKPGSLSRDAMIKKHPKVIVITHLAGFHAGVQAGSGDFSLQAEGELWENGKLVGPLCDFVISGNFREFLTGVEEVGNELPTPTSGIISPELLISSLSIAGA